MSVFLHVHVIGLLCFCIVSGFCTFECPLGLIMLNFVSCTGHFKKSTLTAQNWSVRRLAVHSGAGTATLLLRAPERWARVQVSRWQVSPLRVCVCVCVPPPRRAARLSPKMVSPVQGRSLCCVCSLLHAFKVGGPCSANVPWRADGGFTGGSSHVRALRQAIPAAWTRTWQLIPPPPRITTTERCEGGGWAYHHIGSRSWCCP